jgi:hypothetical protein
VGGVHGCPLSFGGWRRIRFGLGGGRDCGIGSGHGSVVRRAGVVGCSGGRSIKIGGGDLQGIDDQAGALEIDAIAGEPGGHVGERLLDDNRARKVDDLEGLILDDGRDGVVAVGETHVVVVHGAGTAAAASFGGVHALVRNGRLAGEVGVIGHWGTPRGNHRFG